MTLSTARATERLSSVCKVIQRAADTGGPPVRTPESTTGTADPRIRATPSTKGGIPGKGATGSGRSVSRTLVSGTAKV
ncbi:hypothetical protein GCM10022223_44040 [Kineosporia mesophila]|uniref:Uncharacterized protein n=1 Tax=Kineosporia mesophila TaxID=566012 RepID=A0ABP7A0J2_9ACTN